MKDFALGMAGQKMRIAAVVASASFFWGEAEQCSWTAWVVRTTEACRVRMQKSCLVQLSSARSTDVVDVSDA